VGSYARVVDTNGLTQHDGSPYTNRYLNLSANASHEYYGTALDPYVAHDFGDDPSVFVTEGPVCIDGVNLWRVQSSDGFANVWVPETRGSSYLIEPVVGQASGVPAYTPARVVLADVPPELVVDGLAQLAFFGLGGGGGDGLPFYDGDVTIGDLNDFVLSVYPPGTMVSVTFRDPDARVFDERLAYAWRDTNAPVSYIMVDLPAYPGLATGTWTVEFLANGEQRRVAYHLSPPEIPVMTPACERTTPVIYVNGLQPNESIGLSQIESDNSDFDDQGNLTVEIVNHWRLQADSQGTLVIEDFEPYLRPSSNPNIQTEWGIETVRGTWMDTQSYEATFLKVTDSWDCYTSQVGVTPSALWYGTEDLPPRLTPGDRARVVPGDPNNMRDQPSTDGSRIGQIPGGAEFLVLDGPTYRDDFRWWLIMYNDLIGWTVEGQGSDYWLEPVASP